MSNNLKTKAIVIVAVILICLYGIIGVPKSKDELVANWNRNIRLGLDLKGGSQLVLLVQVQDAFKAEADASIERLKDSLRKSNIDFAGMTRNEPDKVETADTIQVDIKGVPAGRAGDFRQIINDQYGTVWNLTSVNATDFRLNMKQSEALDLRRKTVEQTRNTIEKRVNGLGLSEATVQQRGRSDAESELLVQLPGVDDPARIKQIIQTAALLEIAEVRGGPFPTEEAGRAGSGGVLPVGTKLVPQAPRNGQEGSFYLLSRTPIITGRDLRSARPGRDQLGKYETQFSLGQDGAKRFENFTGSHVGQNLAVVLDNKIYSVAVINSKIGDSGVIQGQASQQESSDLALTLQAGSLPAGIVFGEERSVGPSLGADSIRQGLEAGLAGVVAVVLAMLFYYKRSGINATLALILNAIILVAALSYFDATLTLPGIAGIILTIGMAVDSNVLIFERIREELRAGKAVVTAVSNGFSKALVTIVDTHVTTVVSCLVLFIFGTTQVKGFAVTLVIGLIANVFTAVFVSKAIFDYELAGRRQVTTLSI